MTQQAHIRINQKTFYRVLLLELPCMNEQDLVDILNFTSKNKVPVATDSTVHNKCNQEKPSTADFVWAPLDTTWQSKLVSSKFMVKDCLPDGNCQFHSIANALSGAGYKSDHAKLRKVLARYIHKLPLDEFMTILEMYRAEKAHGEFKGDWDPFQVKTKRAFVKHVKTQGFHFEGDNTTLALLSKAIGIDIILFTSEYNIIDLSNTTHLQPKLIILFYTPDTKGSGHYQTVGYQSRIHVNTMFRRDKLPQEVARALNPSILINTHLEHYLCSASFKHLTLHSVTHAIQKMLHTPLTKSEMQTLMKSLNTLLYSGQYFCKKK